MWKRSRYLLSNWSTSMVSLYMLHQGNWVAESSTALGTDINCYLLRTNDSTASMNSLHMLCKIQNGGEPCLALNTHFHHSPVAPRHPILRLLQCLCSCNAQLCHTWTEKACGPQRRCTRTVGGSSWFVFPASPLKANKWETCIRFLGSWAIVVQPKPVIQAMLNWAVSAPDGVGQW